MSKRPVRSAALLLALASLAGVLAYRFSSAGDGTGARGSPRADFFENVQRRPPTQQPNIVFVQTDDQDNTSVNAEAMPYLASEPHGRWWKADMVYNLSLCCPSRAAFLTGQYAHRNRVIDNNSGHLLDENNTVPVRLQEAGYHTCKVGKYLNFWPFRTPVAIPPGWDDWASFVEGPGDPGDTGAGDRDTLQGFYDYTLHVNGATRSFGSSPSDYSTDVLVDHALGCLARAPAGKPFYLDLSLFGPHGPSTPAPRHARLPVRLPPRSPNFNEEDVSDKPGWLQRTPPLTSEQVATWDDRRAQQYRSLRSVDEGIRTVLDALDAMAVLDNTVVVFTSDNANAFGEHRFVTKRCYYEECLRFPLWVRYPFSAAPGGSTDGHLVANVDIAPTLAELAGTTLPWDLDGTSLVGLLEGRPPTEWRTAVLVENRGGEQKGGGRTGMYWALRTQDHTYVELDSGERELYDLRADPYQLQNRAGQPDVAELEAGLAARLETEKRR